MIVPSSSIVPSLIVASELIVIIVPAIAVFIGRFTLIVLIFPSVANTPLTPAELKPSIADSVFFSTETVIYSF